jgi:hypothetical protein
MQYNYTKTINPEQLSREIQSSAITVALDFVTSLGTDVSIFFKAELSPDELTILNNLVSNHIALPSPDQPTVVDLATKSSTRKLPKVEIYEPEGTFYTIVSHDLTDPTTWYQRSVRVENEELVLDSGLIYSFAHDKVIDLTHGKVTKEDFYNIGRELIVRDGLTVLVEDVDFTMDYAEGKLTLSQAPQSTLTADYNYATSSCFSLTPTSGKILTIQHAEVQFTKNIQMTTPLHFDIYAYNPYDYPNKVLVERVVYKNVKDIVNIANLGQGFIPAFGTILNDVLVFPFQYARTIDLKSSQGIEIEVCLKNHIPYTGEFATVTFYCVEEDETT